MKRTDRNGDLIMGFLSRLSGGFTNERFVSLEKKGNVVVKLNPVEQVAIVRRVFNHNTHSLNEHAHTHTQQVHLRAQEYSLQNMSAPEEFGHVQFETNLFVTLNFRTQIESTELRLRVSSKSSGASSPFRFK